MMVQKNSEKGVWGDEESGKLGDTVVDCTIDSEEWRKTMKWTVRMEW